jgi:tetratricopeptide (TPR) repeat protein
MPRLRCEGSLPIRASNCFGLAASCAPAEGAFLIFPESFRNSLAKMVSGLILGNSPERGDQAMNEPHDDNRTVDVPSNPADALDCGLAAGFGQPAAAPRSSLDASQRPVLLRPAEGDSDHVVKPSTDAMPPKSETGDRYQLFGEIARGGMGAVLRGRDVDLGRDLAVKVLLEKHAERPEVVRRFIEEAQIGGQLQHPGVVPVYDIGRFGERPFFTMKLVKGKTLAALLGERADPSADRPRFLAVVLQVAQALAYAHAKGVIHRDLKPANIMVGAFGEVQVMDWGLAKVLPEGGIADEERASREQQRPEETTIRTARSSGSAGSLGTDTEAGALLGTPAYMPPEQANGDVALVDRRADVFGLGAILCEILTGKPPYVGRSHEEVRRKARNGAQADALERLDACGADQELIVLTKACLSPEALARPKDAQAVAEGLTAYLDGVQERLQTAQRERAVALAREAEQAKRRKVQLALAAALVALLVGGGAFAFWRNQQAQVVRQREVRNAEAVAALLSHAEEALKAGDAAKAAVALEAAKKRSDEGGAAEQAERLEGLDADLAILRDLDAVDQFRWTVADGNLPNAAAVARRTREALTLFGVDPEKVSVEDAAARVSASVVRERIVSALDRLLRQEKAAGVRALLRQVDAEPYRDAVRDAVLAEDRANLVELAGQKAALEQPPGFTAFLGESGAIKVERRRQLLQAAVSRRSGDLGLLMTLGGTYLNDRQIMADEGLRWYQAALAAAPANASALNNLGVILCDGKRDFDAAIACFHQAIALDPKVARVHDNLGNALSGKGKRDEAIACFQKSIALDPKDAKAHGNLGIALARKGKVDEAIKCFRKAIALDPKLAKAHCNLGVALSGKGKKDEAIECYKKAIDLDPRLANAHRCLGSALADKGKVDEAIACFKQALSLDPKFAMANANLGTALEAKGKVDEAIACYRKAIALDPKNAQAHNNLGLALHHKGKVDEAIECYNKVIAFDPKLAAAHYNLGNALKDKGQVVEAIACYRKTIALDPKNAEAHCNLGLILGRQSHFAESLAALERGHELGSKRPGWSYPSAAWVRQAERQVALEVKLPAFLKGKFQPSDTAERLGLIGVCQAKKLHAAAARLSADAFAAEPNLADDPTAGLRYNAACSAALAAAGQGEDAGKLDDKERSRLRKQALDWLKADLAVYAKRLQSGSRIARRLVTQQMQHWQKDTDLTGIRDTAALAKLPADEQKAFALLWADVAGLLKKAQAPAQKEDK